MNGTDTMQSPTRFASPNGQHTHQPSPSSTTLSSSAMTPKSVILAKLARQEALYPSLSANFLDTCSDGDDDKSKSNDEDDDDDVSSIDIRKLLRSFDSDGGYASSSNDGDEQTDRHNNRKDDNDDNDDDNDVDSVEAIMDRNGDNKDDTTANTKSNRSLSQYLAMSQSSNINVGSTDAADAGSHVGSTTSTSTTSTSRLAKRIHAAAGLASATIGRPQMPENGMAGFRQPSNSSLLSRRSQESNSKKGSTSSITAPTQRARRFYAGTSSRSLGNSSNNSLESSQRSRYSTGRPNFVANHSPSRNVRGLSGLTRHHSHQPPTDISPSVRPGTAALLNPAPLIVHTKPMTDGAHGIDAADDFHEGMDSLDHPPSSPLLLQHQHLQRLHMSDDKRMQSSLASTQPCSSIRTVNDDSQSSRKTAPPSSPSSSSRPQHRGRPLLSLRRQGKNNPGPPSNKSEPRQFLRRLSPANRRQRRLSFGGDSNNDNKRPQQNRGSGTAGNETPSQHSPRTPFGSNLRLLRRGQDTNT